MLPFDIEQQAGEIHALQNETEHLIQGADDLLRGAGVICTNARRAISSFLSAFISWWGECSLNQERGDKSTLMQAVFPLAMLGLIHSIDDDARENRLTTHPGEYQCVLRRTPPNIINHRPAVGYYLYKTLEDDHLQFHIFISHPEPIEGEHFNLSEEAADQSHILVMLENLPWENLDHAATSAINLDETIERKTLKHWMTSLSERNKVPIRFYDIFWRDDHAEKFCKHLSIEARKPQRINNVDYRALLAEKGVIAKTVTSLGNAASYLRHWGDPPRKWGHNTVINQTDHERDHGGRIPEIYPIFSGITNFFMRTNILEIDQEVRRRCQNAQRPKA